MLLHQHTSAVSRSRARTLAALFLLLPLLFFPLVDDGRAVNELGTTTITLGASNDEQQRQDLLDFFGVTPDVEVIEVSAEETIAATEGIFGIEVEDAYSSTAFTCRDLGQGLDIATANIDLITPSLYALALVTAGVGDGQLVIAAPRDTPETGISALTGIFKMWELEPCTSGVTNPARQRLAQEQLALTVRIGQDLEAEGLPDGVGRAATMVLEAQRQIINGQVREQVEINRALAAQERAQGLQVFEPEREELLALFSRIANSDIDWSTFSEGWTIEYRNADRITMRGEGIAIRNAQASATAAAEATLAAERSEIAGQTATARAMVAMTATAEAQAAINATGTAQAVLAATSQAQVAATAEAQQAAASAASGTAAAQATADAEARAIAQVTAAAEATTVANAAVIALATADAQALIAAEATADTEAAESAAARVERRATENARATSQAEATAASAAMSAAVATSAAEATAAARRGTGPGDRRGGGRRSKPSDRERAGHRPCLRHSHPDRLDPTDRHATSGGDTGAMDTCRSTRQPRSRWHCRRSQR